MKIACLAWGSLLWKAEPLVLASPWHDDGPDLPLEFSRVGDHKELATTLLATAPLQTTWWALLAATSIAEAREQLRQREEISLGHPEWIGTEPAKRRYPHHQSIGTWMSQRSLEAVVWTALPPRYAGTEGREPNPSEAAQYLDGLAGDDRVHAEDYVRRMPARFSTPTRGEIERKLGWYPIER